jgi:hypothetical protein
MKAAELKRKLEALGCEMEDGTKHWIVTYSGIKTTSRVIPARRSGPAHFTASSGS